MDVSTVILDFSFKTMHALSAQTNTTTVFNAIPINALLVLHLSMSTMTASALLATHSSIIVTNVPNKFVLPA